MSGGAPDCPRELDAATAICPAIDKLSSPPSFPPWVVVASGVWSRIEWSDRKMFEFKSAA